MSYENFIQDKLRTKSDSGFHVEADSMNCHMFDWQRAIVQLALRKGCFGGYQDCGLGKTIQELESARWIVNKTNQPVIIFCPLAVAHQTKREANKFAIDSEVKVVKSQNEVIVGINLANYERLHLFESQCFSGVILDEGSILKSIDGKIKNQLLRWTPPYRQSWSATPAPNDHMELGNQSQFLGQLTAAEMMSTFFVHDGGDTSKWRLKGHCRKMFWDWLASWSVVMRSPSDLGFESSGYILPSLQYEDHIVETPIAAGHLFANVAESLADRRNARRDTLESRCELAAEIAMSSKDPCVIWCNLNDEGALLERLIPEAVEVAGRHSVEESEQRLNAFTNGEVPYLVTKPRIGGFGLNWQHCNRTVIFPTDSYEQWYQMVRRFYRFGQRQKVTVHSVFSEAESNVVENLRRKERDVNEMFQQIAASMSSATQAEINESVINRSYTPAVKQKVPSWLM